MAAPQLPPDWVILPGNATETMADAGSYAWAVSNDFAQAWRAMCAKAPRYAQSWSDKPPQEQGWYWHWNGDPDARPVPTLVLYSGSREACFVSAGQLGLKEAVYCDVYGGYWLPLIEPDVPEDTE